MKSKLQVSGMSCGGCQVLINEALEELQGVTASEASYRDGIVSVDFDPEQVTLGTIRSVIEAQGFKVQD